GSLDYSEDQNKNGVLDDEDTTGLNGGWDNNGVLNKEDLDNDNEIDTEDLNGDGIIQSEDTTGIYPSWDNNGVRDSEDLISYTGYPGWYDNGTLDKEDADGDGILDTEDLNGNNKLDTVQDRINYDGSEDYAGYFDTDPTKRYKYNVSTGQFEKVDLADALAYCTGATGTQYLSATNGFCLTIDETLNEDLNKNGELDGGEDTDGDGVLDLPIVNAFAAQGSLLNWLTSSKFDIEKKILTGGKYDATNSQLVLEGRGCLEELFVKKVSIQKVSDGATYFATFGIRPPTEAEKTGDATYNGSISNTRIQIYEVTSGGMDMIACEAAIDSYETGNLGSIKTETEQCLQGSSVTISDSQVAFNHIMQECWYINKFGDFSNVDQAVAEMKADCENVYNVKLMPPSYSWVQPDASYVAPETLDVNDICYGDYDEADGEATLNYWGIGNVGKCWEADYTAPYIDQTCSIEMPNTKETAVLNAAGSNYHYCDGSYWIECQGHYSLGTDKCTPGNRWATEQGLDPDYNAAIPSAAGWTDDGDPDPGDANGFDASEHCIEASLRQYCSNVDVPSIVDPSGSLSTSGTAWILPAVLVAGAVESQLGAPLPLGATAENAMPGRIEQASQPVGLIHEYQYNLRIGAMEFHGGTASECAPIQETTTGNYVANLYDCLVDKDGAITAASAADATRKDGGRIITYIGQGDEHIAKLVDDINDIEATTWTPTVEALYNALGYFTQNDRDDADPGNDLRLNSDDFIWDHDHAAYSAWANATTYAAGDTVRHTNSSGVTKLYFTLTDGTADSTGGPEADVGVDWQSYDPVTTACQTNNILLISDGASTADMHGEVMTFLASNNDAQDGDTWKSGVKETTSYECMAEDGFDTGTDYDHSLYGNTGLDDIIAYGGGTAEAIYPNGYETIDGDFKKSIDFHIVMAGDRPEAATDLECEVENLLDEAVRNGANLYDSVNLSVLESVLRNAFVGIAGEAASGAAASVISHSRSGDGAIYQAIFYPKQLDGFLNEVVWTGDIHSLWLDDHGNIREDCGATCADDPDGILDPGVDPVIEFYSDPVTGSARARRYTDSGDLYEEGILLRELKYIWSAGQRLAGVTAPATQRSYASPLAQRYIFTTIDGTNMVDFTPSALKTATDAPEYLAYLNAADEAEADDIVSYIRGDDTPTASSPAKVFRPRLIDWDGDGSTEIYKLGDVIHSTPTLVSTPAENYDVIYGDESYQLFRGMYRNRRAVVYAGGNDGGLHAFNAGHYDRGLNKFEKGPAGETEYELGAEMWMYIPSSALPHLKWLTDPDYNHVYYTDLKPYVFDAKIFDPTDPNHPGGWGTVLVGGMRYGGGEMGIDINGDGNVDEEDLDGDGRLDVAEDANGNGSLDAGEDIDGDGHLDVAEDVDGDGVLDTGETIRSLYFALDITDPEIPPVLLGEFGHPDLGYSLASPTAIPLLRCDKHAGGCSGSWPMDWYLAIGSGPNGSTPQQAMRGRSDRSAQLFVLKLGGTNDTGGLPYASSGSGPAVIKTDVLSIARQLPIPAGFANSFFSDLITVDYDFSYQADALYFGSVSEAPSGMAGDDHNQHRGGLHRLVIDNGSNDVLDSATWTLNTMIDTDQPVTAAPSVAADGSRAWLYFGTGRFLDAAYDKRMITRQSFYGLKEIYNSDNEMQLGSEYGVGATPAANLVDVTDIEVINNTGTLSAFPVASDGTTLTTLLSSSFTELNSEIGAKDAGLDRYNGWKINYGATGTPLQGERTIGQAAILGDIVTFTSYVPSVDKCQPEGDSYLWAPYYRTGTSYYRSVIGTRLDDGNTVMLRKVGIGKGLATTPNVHTGAAEGSKAFIQTSTGAIVGIEQANPGVTKSGVISWRELNNGTCQ
ncbi:MAG: hypothetical protein P1P81_07465, partial [Desulfobulbales bacterium]|nr:hypothetical protein [Desulfobulbales bacterium]